MGKTNRNQPKNARSSDATTTVFDFERRFPDDSACLDYLVAQTYPNGIRCPKCEKVTKHHRVKSRPCYECQYCGHQEYPMKGTIFEGSSTSLKLWFYGIYLMASTRCGISAKQLERETGVTYPTAHRMFKKIRSLLEQGDDPFTGTIEVDEAYVGGLAKWRSERGRPGRPKDKAPVLGIAQRKTPEKPGQIYAKVVPDSGERSLIPPTAKKVLPGSVVYTDEWKPYRHLGKRGYQHTRIPHAQHVYVDGDVHTNTVEGFWSHLKGGVSGVYHGVSTKYLQSYMDEFVFRYNNRDNPEGMFNAFLGRIEKAPPESA